MAKQVKKKKKDSKIITDTVVTPAGGKTPQCPTGYYWNGTRCVKDIG